MSLEKDPECYPTSEFIEWYYFSKITLPDLSLLAAVAILQQLAIFIREYGGELLHSRLL